MKKFAFLLAIMVAFLSASLAFGGEGGIRVGYAQAGHESDWRIANTRDFEAVFSKEAGFDLTLIDCDNDNGAQLEAVRSFIAQGFDYIVISPIQSIGWDTVLLEALEAGIPVILVDREIEADPSLYNVWVGSPNF